MKIFQKSPEGIPWKEYRFLSFFLAFFVAIFLEFFFFLMRLLTVERSRVQESDIPKNALIMTYHGESYLNPLTPHVFSMMQDKRFVWLGFHGLLSYLGSMQSFIMGLSCFRFDRNKKQRAFDQVVSWLKENPQKALMLRTDAGGPYWKIRKSLVSMAQETQRPIICLRVYATRKMMINQHKIALPGARIDTCLSEVISVEDLKGMNLEKAVEFLEKRFGPIDK